jgi:hypothetical protein
MVTETADLPFPSPAGNAGLDIDGGHIFAALGFSGLQILDLADSDRPSPLGRLDPAGYPYRVAVDDSHYAYMLTSVHRHPFPLAYRLEIADARDAYSPKLVSSAMLHSLPGAIALDDVNDLAFVTTDDDGLLIFDVSNTSVPRHLASLSLPNPAHDLKAHDKLLFIADGPPGLLIIDVSNPAKPRMLGACDTPGSAVDVDVVGQVAYVADDGYAMQVIDVADPHAPTSIGHVETVGSSVTIHVAGDIAYLRTSRHAVEIFDISDERSPKHAGNYRAGFFNGDNAFTNGHVYALTYGHPFFSDMHLYAIDVTSPRAPVELDPLQTSDSGASIHGRVVLRGTRVCVVMRERRRLDISDISVFRHPRLTGTLRFPSEAWDVDLDGDGFAYVAQAEDGLAVVDLADPSAPRILVTADTPGRALGVAVDGELAYVADEHRGLTIFDVRERSAPKLLGNVDTRGFAHAVIKRGNRAYIADGAFGLAIIDIANPESPAVLGTAAGPPGGIAFDVALASESYAYLVDGQVQVFDISDERAPLYRGSVDSPGEATGLAIVDETLYVSDKSFGVLVYDLSNPDLPDLLGIVWTVGSKAIDAQYPILACINELYGGIILPGQCRGNATPFAANGTDPEASAPARLSLAQNTPNPFTTRAGRTAIAFDMETASPVTIRIYDISGRLVRELLDAALPAGRHTVSWNGRDERGIEVGTGVYFYRLEAGSFIDSRRLLRVR